MMDTKRFSQSLEDYLETILLEIRRSGGEGARISDIAEKLKVKKPSVIRAIGELKEEGLVKHKPYGKVLLTPTGEETASKVYEKHRLLFCFLHHLLGVDLDRAEEEACAIEHCISKTTKEKLAAFLEKYEERRKEDEQKSGRG